MSKLTWRGKIDTFVKRDMACTRLPLAQTTFGRDRASFVSFDQHCQKVTPTLYPDFGSPRVLVKTPTSGKTSLVAPPKWPQEAKFAKSDESAQKGCTPRKPTAQRMDLYAMYCTTQHILRQPHITEHHDRRGSGPDALVARSAWVRGWEVAVFSPFPSDQK